MKFLAFAGVQGQLLCEHCEPYSDGPIGTDAGSKGKDSLMWRVGRLGWHRVHERKHARFSVMSWVECPVRNVVPGSFG